VPDAPFGLVTTTLYVPAEPIEAVVMKIVELLLKPDITAEDVPIFTVAPLANPQPVTVTVVPPFVGPEDGVIELIAIVYVYLFVNVELIPSGFITTTSYIADTRDVVVKYAASDF